MEKSIENHGFSSDYRPSIKITKNPYKERNWIKFLKENGIYINLQAKKSAYSSIKGVLFNYHLDSIIILKV